MSLGLYALLIALVAAERLLTHALVLPTQLPAARNRLVPLAAAFPRVFAGAVDALGG